MSDFQETLDELFNEKLNFEYDGRPLPTPEIDGNENIINYTKEYVGFETIILLVICTDRIIEFQKKFIKSQKVLFPNAHFLFVSNSGKVFDLYNNATSKVLKKITYDEIGRNTRLFKEKLQLFDVTQANDSTELQINAEKAFETSDRITKKFFDKFKKIHDKLQKAITGIDDEKDKSWYASVMMNRIMFIYFLQKHYVIQGNTSFLLDKFEEVSKVNKDYYTEFLLPLFFYGFARRDGHPLKQKFVEQYGPIKYLNGGLFYAHHIEKKYCVENPNADLYEEQALNTKIGIDAKLIKEILEFLDGYTWYLDNRPMKEDTDINPDVLGYIFEKYINQKELGAYYTKEDITEYISKNTIIASILDKMKRKGYNVPDSNSMITNNEDIIEQMNNYVENITSYKEVKFLYKDVLLELSVLDPSVGSGAFLFAALNILLPIYQKAVFKMKEFAKTQNDEWLHETILTLSHHAEEYYLTKQIILNNLYGVDIVEEATEICKLRLFLQLASHLPDITSIEPLPDIDFNIYAGNSLVGGLSWDDIEYNYKSLFNKDGEAIDPESLKEKIKLLTEKKQKYREIQQLDESEEEFSILKGDISFLINHINNQIDFDIDNPFHWFINFNKILEKDGFDVIIGNPPYVEYAKVRKYYELKGYSTIKCGNLYGNFIERSFKIISKYGYNGLIIPLSFSCTKRMEVVQKLFFDKTKNVWLSHFAERPSKLFDGAEVILDILIYNREDSIKSNFYTTTFLKWKSEERSTLFSKIKYTKVDKIRSYLIPKFGGEVEKEIWVKIHSNRPIGTFLLKNSESKLYYRIGGGRYWKIFTDFQPKFLINDEQGISSRENYLYFKDESQKYIAIALLSSSLFYWYFINTTNCRDLNPSDLQSFPINLENLYVDTKKEIIALSKSLMNDYHQKSKIKIKESQKTGSVTYQEFYPRLSKDILDKIDIQFGSHYGLSENELNFIIDYDLKYRMGSELEELE